MFSVFWRETFKNKVYSIHFHLKLYLRGLSGGGQRGREELGQLNKQELKRK